MIRTRSRNKPSSQNSCEFAEPDPCLQDGRICKLDHGACFNYSRPKLVDRCPSRLAYLRGEPVGTTPDLGFPGVPHVVESGPVVDRVLGMPLEYLAGRIKRGAAAE
jgi:hypothetical protein